MGFSGINHLHAGDGRAAAGHPARNRRTARGFTLVEILIVVVILGVLAVLVVPRFSNASQMTNENKMREDLRMLRTQIQLYAAEHTDQAPGIPAGGGDPEGALFEAQMTLPTNSAGEVSATRDADHRRGPYLMRMPENPFNSFITVRMVGPGVFPAAADGTHGWVFQPSTLKVASDATGADSRGVDYINY